MFSSSDHVGLLSILFMFVTLLICFGVPIALATWAKVRFKHTYSLIPLLAGVLGFLLSQIVFRLPITEILLPQFGWYKQFMEMQWLFPLFLSFTAGLVEEPARFIAFTIMKKRRSFLDGLSYGIGHGGIEAILIVGISYIGNIIISIIINTSSTDSGSMIPAPVISGITGMSPYIFLVAGLERIFTISLHIALSLVVLKGFQIDKKVLYLMIAIVLHGLGNFLALAATRLGMKVMAGSELGGILFAEGSLLIIAVLSVLYIMKQAKEWRENIQSHTEMSEPENSIP